MQPILLDRGTWRGRQAAHQERVAGLLQAHLDRQRSATRHPVEDFLFTYYFFRPAQLRQWHPGAGVVLVDADPTEFGADYVFGSDNMFGSDYVVSPSIAVNSDSLMTAPATASSPPAQATTPMQATGPVPATAPAATAPAATLDTAAVLNRRRDAVARIRDLLAATTTRLPQFGCFGLHEWAMVYQQSPEELRHNAWPLRLSTQDIADVVRAGQLRCTHYDAFRFFTPAARPLNLVSLTRNNQVEYEQPGCLHANMDLYRWAFKLSPLIPSELIVSCFELARDIRVIDMRASPYDLAGLGYQPIRVETPEGRMAYVSAQRSFTERSTPLRAQLLDYCRALLAPQVSDPVSPRLRFVD